MIYSAALFDVLKAFVIIIVNFSILISYVNTNEVELRTLLFKERAYDTKVCPEKGITKVHTNLIFLQIESVDEKAQVCSVLFRLFTEFFSLSR